DAAAQGQQLLGAEALNQPAVAGQHHRQENMAVETGGGQKAQLSKDLRHHLLCLIDDQHGPDECRIDMCLPALSQNLATCPAVVRAQVDAEQRAHLSIEV